MLKASVASRTLDNITGVIVAFKNFRKTIKNELGSPSVRPPAEGFRQAHLNTILNLPNCDLTWEDIARPENMSKSEISLDTSAILHSKS